MRNFKNAEGQRQYRERHSLDVCPFNSPVLASLIGPLIAGFVGGRKAGTVGDAILAVILPGIVFGALLFFFGTLMTGVPLVGFIAGAGAIALVFAHVGPLLIGAILGALL